MYTISRNGQEVGKYPKQEIHDGLKTSDDNGVRSY